jgi:hypothetical protein
MRRLSLPIVVATLACTHPSAPDLGWMPIHDVTLPPGVALTARAEATQDTVYAWVTFTNSSAATVEATFGACAFAVRVVGVGHAWDNRLPPHAGCPDVQHVLFLQAGESWDDMVLWRPVTEIRPTGSPRPYRLWVYFWDRVRGRLQGLDAGTVVF